MPGRYVGGWGSSSAKLIVVGEAPGAREDESGIPFSGPAGDLLNQALTYAGTDRNDCYITNVVKVRPPNNDLTKLPIIGHSIEEFIPQLWDEITTIDPNCILALGNTALTVLTGFKGIEKYRGSILQCKTGHKVVPTLHTATLLHEGGMKTKWSEFAWIKADVKRAYEQSLFNHYSPPSRNLIVCQSSVEVLRFLDKHTDKDKVTLDVETFKTIPQCIGLSFNDWEAVSIPLFNDEEIPSHDQVFMWRALSEFLQDTKIKIMAQNAKFDEKRCRQIGLDWHDCWFSMDMGWHILFPEFPKKLQFISSVLTEEPYYKDEGTEFNKGKSKEQNLRQWFLYNAKDAVVEFECCEKILQELKDTNLYEFYFDKIQPLHRLYSDIEDIGILIDEQVRKDLGIKYEKLRKEKQEWLIDQIADGNSEIREVYKNFNVMSNGPKNQVAKLLYGFLKLPVRKDTGDDTLKALSNNVCSKDKSPRRKNICMGVLEVRKVRKTIGTYINAEPSPCDVTRFGPSILILENKPRIHTQCNINGAETGRTSTGILKPPVSVYKEGIALQTMTKHEDTQISEAGGADLRAEFIADEGWSFVEADQSQAEDRVVCVLAKDWDALKSYDKKEWVYNKHGCKDDRHTLTAMQVCSMIFEDITDYQRQIGKKTKHAINYDMQKHMHMLNLAKFGGIFISEYAAGKQLERAHEANPNIRGVYHAETQQALQDNDCTIFTPHGRRRIFFNKFGPELFKEAYAYIPQATISDQTKFAMLSIIKEIINDYKKNFFFVQESHDSFLALVRDFFISTFSTIVRKHLETPINFSKCTLSRDYDLIIPCEIKVGKRWIDKSDIYPDGMEKMKA